MTTILDKFKDSSIGSSGRIMDFSSKINPSGDFTKLYDLDVILNSWSNILLTPKESYDHDPEFGSNLFLLIFDPADSKTEEAIKEEIIRATTTYDNRATIDSIDVAFMSNQKGFSVSIVVNYYGYKNNMSLNFDETTFQFYM